MTKSEVIALKKRAFKPQFKDLIGLEESGKTATLLDFCAIAFPGRTRHGQGSKVETFGEKHHVFTIYTKGILQTEVETKARVFYPF